MLYELCMFYQTKFLNHKSCSLLWLTLLCFAKSIIIDQLTCECVLPHEGWSQEDQCFVSVSIAFSRWKLVSWRSFGLHELRSASAKHHCPRKGHICYTNITKQPVCHRRYQSVEKDHIMSRKSIQWINIALNDTSDKGETIFSQSVSPTHGSSNGTSLVQTDQISQQLLGGLAWHLIQICPENVFNLFKDFDDSLIFPAASTAGQSLHLFYEIS